MTQRSNTARSNEYIAPTALRWFIYLLAALNVIVFGILLLRIVLYPLDVPLLSGGLRPASPDILLLDGLKQQKGRLEDILAGSCDSPGMDQYLKGEIGPLVRSPAPGRSTQLEENGQPAARAGEGVPAQPEAAPTPPPPTRVEPEATSPSQSSAPPPGSAAAPRVSGGDLLSPGKLRGLVDRSVVRVVALQGGDNMMTGTGFAISPDTIVTNRHVIAQAGNGQLLVTSKYLGDEPIKARLLATTESAEPGAMDFAVLKLENAKALTPLNVGDDPQPLESVVAAGYPGLTVQSDSNGVTPDVVFSQGDVSVVQPQSNDISLVIHTANISPGSSGGPLINRCGTVIGVNTFVSSGDEYTGRALYSLSGRTLATFLRSSSIPFNTPSANECGAGAN